jgi:regulatory protein
MGGQRPFRDAEEWLAERGVAREPIRPAPPSTTSPAGPAGTRSDHGPGDAEPVGDGVGGRLEDEVSKAVTYARRATARTPMAESRLRRRLEDRDHRAAVVEEALRRCRQQRIVDDQALAAALVEEGRAKGHAPLRIRTDLVRRELPEEVVEDALAAIGDRDEEAAAYDVAIRRAAQLRGVDAETAFRRLAGYLARRGYTDSLSRKVARQAVFHDRERERTAGR